MVFISHGMCIILKWDIYDLAFAGAIIAVLAALVTSYEAWKLIRYNAREMLSDVWKPLLIGGLMGTAVLTVGRFLPDGVPNIISLLVKVAVGVAVYLGLSLAERSPELHDILDLLKGLLNHKKTNE